MKKIVATTALSLLLAVATSTVQAQDKPVKKEGNSEHLHRAEGFNRLQLSKDQKAKFRSMNDEFRQQMQELKKKDDITVKDWRNRMETLRKDHREKMQGLLTNEQRKQLQKMKQDRQSMRKIDRDARAEKMKIRLGLTDDQSTRLKKSRTELEGKMKALRENKSITDDQRKEQMRQLRDNQRENLKSILSEDQLKKLHEKQGPRRRKEIV